MSSLLQWAFESALPSFGSSYVGFDDLLYCIRNPAKYALIHTMSATECVLISGTLGVSEEEVSQFAVDITRHGVFMTVYLDDTAARAKAPDISNFLRAQEQQGSSYGYLLQPKKCGICIGPRESAEEAYAVKAFYLTEHPDLDEDCIKIHPTDFRLSLVSTFEQPLTAEQESTYHNYCESYGRRCCGIPLGHDAYIVKELNHILDEVDMEVDCLLSSLKSDPHLAFYLYKQVVEYKVNYLLRAYPPESVASKLICSRYTRTQNKAISNLLAIENHMEDDCLHFAIARSSSGFKLLQMHDTAAPAFVASIVASIDAIEFALPGFKQTVQAHLTEDIHLVPSLPLTTRIESFVSAIRTIGVSWEELMQLNGKHCGKIQHILTKKIKDNRLSSITTRVKTSMHPALYTAFQSLSTKESAAWMNVRPDSEETSLASDQFRILGRVRLLLPVDCLPEDRELQCPCGAPLDPFGFHLQKCKKLSGLTIQTHDDVLRLLEAMAIDCGIRTESEVLINANSKERMDLITFEYAKAPTHFDVTIVNAVTKAIQETHVGSDIVVKPLQRAMEAERTKKQKYGATIKSFGHKFIPVAIEAHGAWGPAFKKWFKEFTDEYHKVASMPKSIMMGYWRSRISMALAQGFTRAILGRVHAINKGILLSSQFAEDIAFQEGTIEAQTGPLHIGNIFSFSLE